MKVRMEIEFEMDSLNPDNPVKKTPEELIKGLTVNNHDVVDGFEITTDFQDTDNSVNFYIVPDSVRILRKENMDLTRETLAVEDMEINDDEYGVNSQFIISTDIDKKFGTNINNEDGAWLNFYATYYPDTDELTLDVYITRENSYEDIDYTPTAEETALIKTLMREYCQEQEGMSIEDLIETYSDNQNMTGGMA